MFSWLRKTFISGLARFLEHPQLWYTILVAVAIVFSFLYVSNRFIAIAKNAEDELTNVRVGSIQDAFAPLARELIQDPETLRGYMQNIRSLNPTITDFVIVRPDERGWHIAISTDTKFESNPFLGNDFLLNLALSDPNRSYTVQETEGSSRFFRTARAITDASSTVTGIAITRQHLSEADRQIEQSIRSGILTLIFILVILLALFFRHARIVDYTVLYRQLREIDHLKDDFIAMASHELRSPLTAIRAYADMLKDENKISSSERVLALERIDVSAVTLNHLIEDMLDVSRIEQGRMKMELIDQNPAELLQKVYDFLKPTADAKNLEFVLESTPDIKIRMDEDRLRQVLINLAGNAIKYTPKGKVTIKMSAVQENCIIRVSDSGLGMSADVREHLFEKFYRAPGLDVRKESGTGLGLWITKQLVEKMDGHISVESIEGVGSHFIVSFPLVSNK